MVSIGDVSFAGKRILLTGAAGGLGEATAKALAEQGATLILSSRNREKLEEMAGSLPGGPHEVVAIDLTDPNAVASTIEQSGQIDILIANAGRSGGWALDDTPSDEIHDVIHVNFEVPIQMAKAVIPQMKARKSGQIVLIASMAGKFALPESTLYSSTKSGLRTFGWALRAELAKSDVGVTVVTPSFIREVGMFAKRNRKPPPGAGTSSPDAYVSKLLKGIDKNDGEIVIAPLQLRVIGQLSLTAPGLFERVFRKRAPQRKPADQ
jgi:short-subunit dehydrogenase